MNSKMNMQQGANMPVRLSYPVVELYKNNVKTGFIPIAFLEMMRDRLNLLCPGIWLDFNGDSIPSDHDRHKEFLAYLTETFKWKHIQNFVQYPEEETTSSSNAWNNTKTNDANFSKRIGIINVPNHLYRYFDFNPLYLDCIFKKGCLRLSPPTSFNDPFDCNYDKKIKQLLSNKGVYCFSAKNDNILMWSHYANKHKGFCLIINPTKLYSEPTPDRQKFTADFRRVFYLREPYLFKPIEKYIAIHATTKSHLWAYEAEYRLFFKNNDNELQPPGNYNIPLDAICGVIFGAEMGKKEVDMTMEATNHLANQTFRRIKAKRHSNKFSLIFKDL